MFRSVRARITLVATAVVAVALLVASILIVWMVEADLIDATERALSAELELEAALFDFDGEPQFFEFDASGEQYALGVFLEDDGIAIGSIFDPFTSEPIAEVGIDTEQVAIIDIFDPFTGERIEDAALVQAVEALNFDFRDLDGDDGNLLLVGAVARDEVDESLAVVRNALLIIVPAFAALMGALIWWLVGRALRPVQAMSRQVEAITTSNLDQRVRVPGGNDEISLLARVMNGMLNRLERGDVRQRQFAADASHELRSPLSTVRTAAEMIERNPASERAPSWAADIVAEADRMDTLIGDLLALARVDEESDSRNHSAVDLTALASTFRGAAGHIESGLIVAGDSAQLQRALENLVQNAHRHAASTVAISARRVVDGTTAYAQISVEDDGAGVPDELRAVIFERFSRLDEARSRDQGGVGLGLALVQAIVARHRGTITVDQSPSLRGARFIILLPLVATSTA